MDITASDIRKFQALARVRYKLDIDDDTARQKLSLLVRQMELIYQPITTNQLKKLKNEDCTNECSRPKDNK
jgi:hypothetical protein